MGRANSKPRKKKGGKSAKPRHLAKVGSAPGLKADGSRERAAVMDVMGMGNRSTGARNVWFGILALVMVAAIVALVIFNTL
jgi:hypothetical protein